MRDFYLLASITKVAEGGSLTQKDVKHIAKEMGIECRVGNYSPYVGNFGVMVKTEDDKLVRKFLKRVGLG